MVLLHASPVSFRVDLGNFLLNYFGELGIDSNLYTRNGNYFQKFLFVLQDGYARLNENANKKQTTCFENLKFRFCSQQTNCLAKNFL